MRLAFWPSSGLEETQPFFAPALLVPRDDSGHPKHTAVLEPTPACAKELRSKKLDTRIYSGVVTILGPFQTIMKHTFYPV